MPPNQNHLIERLPRNDRLRLLSVCELVELPLAQLVCETGVPMLHAYFPNHGSISLATAIDKHAGVCVGMVGREGVVGAHLAYGVAIAPLRAIVQETGVAWRVGQSAFRIQLSRSLPLQRVLAHYSYVTLAQFALSIGCQRFHALGARLARWLVMRHDRAQSDSFLVTHVSLGEMLGVRRVGVTIAAGALQTRGLITYSRGTITVLNRRGLENAACSCYDRDRTLYEAFMPSGANMETKRDEP